ncbi:hypothetical protein BC834DRAFT_907157 [Gloeopeniophorella convolvens]|nr:hypothetical protein BC834DRAFT_907157 [Gloeopeniophorella convolvens]
MLTFAATLPMRLRSQTHSSKASRGTDHPRPAPPEPSPPSRRAAKKPKTAAAATKNNGAKSAPARAAAPRRVAAAETTQKRPVAVAKPRSSPKPELPRNPVDRLSSELLRDILQVYAQINPPGSHGWGILRSIHLGWIEFAHVCRKWRQAALDCPSVWADIDFSLGPKWIEAMLARSKPSPIRLRMHQAPLSLPFDDFLAKHVSRTGVLYTAATQLDKIGPHSKWMSLPAPHLQALTLVPRLYFKHKLVVSKLLPDHPFADKAPKLRNITVLGYNNFFWGSRILRSVSTLIIGKFDESERRQNEYDRPSYDQLLSALESMSQLETLHLNFCLPCKPPQGAARTVKMPSIKTLLLRDATTECLDVFENLRVPNAHLTLMLSADEDRTQPPNDIKQRIRSALREHFATSSRARRRRRQCGVVGRCGAGGALRTAPTPAMTDHTSTRRNKRRRRW